MPPQAHDPIEEILTTGRHYAELIERIDRRSMTQQLRDHIDAIARRINAASEKNVYGFEIDK